MRSLTSTVRSRAPPATKSSIVPAAQQSLLVERVFINILDTTGKDYNDPASAYHLQYDRGYQAINTLFPAANFQRIVGVECDGPLTVHRVGPLY
jgi:hypothetical protein